MSSPQSLTVFTGQSTVTVLDGSSFCVSDTSGDVVAPNEGFFVDGTRVLSRYVTFVDGERLHLLSGGGDRHFEREFHLRRLLRNPHRADEVTIVRRRRLAGRAFEDELVFRNLGQEAEALEVVFEVAADFGSSGKKGEGEEPTPTDAERGVVADGKLLVEEVDGPGRVGVSFLLSSPKGQEEEGVQLEPGRARLLLELEPGEERRLLVLVSAEAEAQAAALGLAYERAERELRLWYEGAPSLRAPYWPELERAFRRSLADLAALRITEEESGEVVYAAGVPWFMSLFGRDVLITCLETMLLGPEMAKGALRALAALQATEDDPNIEAEPGKIVHELRGGKKARSWFSRYYATVDATPLWLILLSEVYRFTGDGDFCLEMREPAMRALEWCDNYGDRDSDGFVEYVKRRPGERGLSVHTWKDSHHSQMFRDGTMALAPIAALEVQGYVYDAKRRLAEVAREAWAEEGLAVRLESEARELYRRINASFWLEDEEYYALALDRDKRPVDALASNMGHLLWSGAVPGERLQKVAARLLGPELFSGFALRTMGAQEGGYHPNRYHNGAAWPHDTALAAWGFARNWHDEGLLTLARGLMDASSLFDDQLPELFAGYARDDVPFPVVYPATCKPQAWAAAVPVLLVRLLLRLEPDTLRRTLVPRAAPPAELEGLELSGVRAFGKRFDVTVRQGDTLVVEAE